MIQKCPECGRWCATESENFFERAFRGFSRQINECGEIGEKHLGKIGKLGGKLFGAYSSTYRAAIDAFGRYKYQFQCECGHSWGTDNKEDDQTAFYEHWYHVAELNEKYSEIYLDEENECEEYEKELQEAWENEFNTPITQAVICDVSAALHFNRALKALKMEDYERETYYLELALKEINTSLELVDDDSDSHITKGMILSLRDKNSHYDILKETIHCKEIKEHPYFSIEIIKEFYDEVCERYKSSFLEIPKAERKYLVLVSDYVAIPDSFKVLRMANIPDNLKLLGDNILKNTLYVIHPLKDDTYIPVNDYAIELFREQLYEYREIMECLGAKTFSIKDVHSNNSENSKDTTYKVGGGGECKGYSAKGSYESKKNTEQYKQLYNELSQEVKCELSRQPFIPENTLWYKHKSDWQRNCDSRIASRMLVFKQNVTNRISTGLTKQDSKMIEGEFNSMIAKLNGSYESDAKFSLKEDAEHTWEISVEFYPMSEYSTHTEQKPSLQLSSNEEKYIATVKTYLEEDGVISPKERRLLETLSESLGISNQRAKELESLLIVPKSSKRKWWQKIF